ALRMFERRYIIGVLNSTNWNRGEAARLMKIHRNTLFMKMKELKIREPRG
ncbi:MAG: sigma-54-dependent Fis family transcriptional regulator, partial [Deltaproteobacteria bacterium]|nr:sigma-54-dependent Fis family transcriptional regulator [Deltaproteobacteria bacterium]